MKLSRDKQLSGKTRNLLLVGFFTLTLSSLAFLLAVYSLDLNNRAIFSYVETTIQNNSRSSDLYRRLVALELDIRDLISVILREPYRLTLAKDSLKQQFEQIQLKAEQGDANPRQQKLLKQLRWYRASLDRLLWDYGEVNSVLYEVYFYINNIKEQLIYLEEAAEQIMVDLAMEDGNTDAVQQANALVTSAREKMLQIHILVNSAIANNNLQLLVADNENAGMREDDTALGKFQVLADILRTLTASDEIIANYANSIRQTLPLLRDNIVDLSVKFNSLNEHQRLFIVERDNSMKLLDDLDEDTRSRILSIHQRMKKHSANTRLTAWVISFVVLFISAVGFILTRMMGRQLEQSTSQAITARESAESLNLQLRKEVEERRRIAEDLAAAKDELEQKVRDRTVDLSAANRGLALEVEERRNAEYALASEKEQLAVTLRSIGDGVITTGLNGRVALINKVAEELTGWQQKEAVGQPLSEVFHIVCKESGEPCENPVDILLRSGSICNMVDDAILIARDGSQRDISDSCAPIRDRDSNIIGAVLVFRDVTGKKKMQDEALKSEKLKSVGVLAGGIAHDFNNILAAILGNISLAKLQINRQKDAVAWKLLESAEKASLRARNLTQQLLTFSRGGEPVKKVGSISAIIKDSADFILSGGRVYCEYEIDEDLWPVNIDTGQISQVVQNIIINAMHAMPGGGKINVTCTNFLNKEGQVVALPDGNYVRISIKDDGPGIPRELLDKIFDPYFTTKEEGSGLGLALTRSIVIKHQGYIEVYSDSEGTDFVIYLPAMNGHVIEEETTPANIVAGQERGKVLIMDDEEMVRDIARDLLVHLGFAVSTVGDGQKAVALYREQLEKKDPFDAVIMDLTIPGGMGGKEAIRKLREMDPLVKGIVSSGYSNDPVMAEYEKYGFVGMVHKPFEIQELVRTLSSVIGSTQDAVPR
ncbi:MAG: ATP-binding protein [Desulfobulbaceae bacterium]|nr:ATP-binding protein [Desulfobulbaceae bacterium]